MPDTTFPTHGPLIDAVIEALFDRGEQKASAAARLLRDGNCDDELWSLYIGPMLDAIAERYAEDSRIDRHFQLVDRVNAGMLTWKEAVVIALGQSLQAAGMRFTVEYAANPDERRGLVCNPEALAAQLGTFELERIGVYAMDGFARIGSVLLCPDPDGPEEVFADWSVSLECLMETPRHLAKILQEQIDRQEVA